MIDERFLEPFIDLKGEKALKLGWHYCLKVDTCVHFLKSMSDEHIKALGHSIFWIFPQKIAKQITNNRIAGEEYDFIDDYRQTYGLSSTFTTDEKIKGIRLFTLLKKHPDLTAEEFINNTKI